MTDPIDLWDTLIDDGVAALDFHPVTGAGGLGLLVTEVGASGLHPNALMAAHAAMEIDKLIAFDLAGPEDRAAVQMRRTLLEAMAARTPNDDLQQAMAQLLDRYRIALARAVRRAAGEDPGRRLAEIGSPHA